MLATLTNVFSWIASRILDYRALRQLHLGHALRGGIVCTAPAVLAVILHAPLLSWSAIAAFWTCFSDPGGRQRTRLTYALSFGVAGALASGIASWSAALPALAVALAGAAIFAGAFARAGGPKVGLIGLLVATAFGVSTAFPGADFAHAVCYAAYFIVGNLWAVGFDLIWPENEWASGRRAVAACFIEISELAFALSRHTKELFPEMSTHDYVLGTMRARIRARLETARNIIVAQLGELPAKLQTQREFRLVTNAEQAFVALVGLEDLLARDLPCTMSQNQRDLVAHALAKSGESLNAIAHCCYSTTQDVHLQFAQQLVELDDAFAPFVSGRNTCKVTAPAEGGVPSPNEVLLRLRQVLKEAQHVLQSASSEESVRPWNWSLYSANPSFASQLITNLSLESTWFQYALRVALAGTIAVGLVQYFEPDHGYWLILTALFITQSSFASTLQVSAQRVGGTMLGGLLAVALGSIVHSPLVLAALILPLSVAMLAGRSVSYFAYTLFLTPHFILVAYIGKPGVSELTLALSRTLNSLVGAGIGIAISLFVWPGWERDRISHVIAMAIEASSRYFTKALTSVATGINEDVQLADLRRSACIATDQIETAVKDMAFEPGSYAKWISEGHATVAALRRTIRAVTLIELSTTGAPAAISGVTTFSDWVRDGLAQSVLLLHGERMTQAPVCTEPPVLLGKGLTPSMRHSLYRISEGIAELRALIATASIEPLRRK